MELVAVVFAVKIWRHYLSGVPYRINADNQSLKYIFTQRKLNLHEISVWQIQYQPRKRNIVAGALNRKVQYTFNTVVTTQLNLLRELEDLAIQLMSHRKANVQLLALTLQPSLMENIRVNQDSDPELQRIKQNLDKGIQFQ